MIKLFYELVLLFLSANFVFNFVQYDNTMCCSYLYKQHTWCRKVQKVFVPCGLDAAFVFIVGSNQEPELLHNEMN